MSKTLREKVIQLRQKTALKDALVLFGDKLQIAQQIQHPESAKIALLLKKHLETSDELSSSTRPFVTRDLLDVNNSFAEFLAKNLCCDNFLCVLPGLSIVDDHVLTRFPVLETDASSVKILYSYFSIQQDFDFFGMLDIHRKVYWVVSSYADFPSESNNLFDGPIYDLSTGE